MRFGTHLEAYDRENWIVRFPKFARLSGRLALDLRDRPAFLIFAALRHTWAIRPTATMGVPPVTTG